MVLTHSSSRKHTPFHCCSASVALSQGFNSLNSQLRKLRIRKRNEKGVSMKFVNVRLWVLESKPTNLLMLIINKINSMHMIVKAFINQRTQRGHYFYMFLHSYWRLYGIILSNKENPVAFNIPVPITCSFQYSCANNQL